MIGYLKGTLVHKQPPEVVIDVNGVGYEVLVPLSTLFTLPALGAQITLVTHFVVREDAQQLYGFVDRDARQLFRDLIKVNGVGPKMGLAILSGIDSDDFVRCVQQGDVAALTKVPGVGKKTAERLVIEMRDRLKDRETVLPSAMPRPTDHRAEAESALVALGYKPAEASKAISRVDQEGATSEELIRAALKNMG